MTPGTFVLPSFLASPSHLKSATLPTPTVIYPTPKLMLTNTRSHLSNPKAHAHASPSQALLEVPLCLCNSMSWWPGGSHMPSHRPLTLLCIRRQRHMSSGRVKHREQGWGLSNVRLGSWHLCWCISGSFGVFFYCWVKTDVSFSFFLGYNGWQDLYPTSSSPTSSSPTTDW